MRVATSDGLQINSFMEQQVAALGQARKICAWRCIAGNHDRSISRIKAECECRSDRLVLDQDSANFYMPISVYFKRLHVRMVVVVGVEACAGGNLDIYAMENIRNIRCRRIPSAIVEICRMGAQQQVDHGVGPGCGRLRKYGFRLFGRCLHRGQHSSITRSENRNLPTLGAAEPKAAQDHDRIQVNDVV